MVSITYSYLVNGVNMAQYSKSRNNKLKPQKNDDIYEVNLLAHKNGNFVSDQNPWGREVIRVDDDTVQHTSKNRRKVSNIEVIDYATFQYGTQEDVWDTKVSGSGTYSFDPNLGMTVLSVGSDTGAEVIRQTNRVQRYIPGRMNEISMAVRFTTPTIGVRRRFGLFDEEGGAYFEDGGDGEYYCVIRRTLNDQVLEERYPRSQWNQDKLDGTGTSGIIADPDTIQLMVIEYEWYGAGQVEFKFVIDNNAYSVHQINHANTHDHPWTNTPFLPVRIELTNFNGASGTHNFYQGSHSVSAEGNLSVQGRLNSISNNLTGKTLTSSNTFYPLVAIRLKSDRLKGVVSPINFSGATLDNTNIFLRLVENATVTGGTWVSYDSDSPVEYNITATSFTGGNSTETVLVSSGNQGTIYNLDERSINQIKRLTTTELGDTSGNLVLAGATSNSNKSAWGSLSWLTIR